MTNEYQGLSNHPRKRRRQEIARGIAEPSRRQKFVGGGDPDTWWEHEGEES